MTIDDGAEVTVSYVGRPVDQGGAAGASEAEPQDRRGDDGDGSLPEGDPKRVTFEVGSGRVLGALEEAVRGMDEGERRTVRVPPEDAYGGVHDDLIVQLDREGVRDVAGEDPEPGMAIVMQSGIDGRVVEVDDQSVTVDFNHRLAGEAVELEIEVLDVESP